MKKAISLAVLALVLIPLTTEAAWWNPLSWFVRHAATSTTEVSLTVASTTEAALPTIDDLNRRIAELESKLDEARKKIKDASAPVSKPAETPVSSQSPASSSGLSINQINAKVRPAIVLVETATSTGTGTFIDSQGHILVDAHTVWTQDQNKNVVGAADKITVTLSNGTKKSAKLIGLDEDRDLAIIRVTDKTSPAYVKLNHDSGIKTGDKVYVLGYPSGASGASGGSSAVSATIVKMGSTIETVSDSKPLDMGGAMVNDAGGFIGIPNKSVCRVLEQGTNCLKYTITANISKTVLPKIIAGMQLYKDKKNSTAQESLIRGSLEGMYKNFRDSGIIDYAVTISTGKNSFEYFNSKLGEDRDGKITRLYLLKLKSIAEAVYNAMDLFKSQAYALNIFFINESSNIETLNDYERATVARLQTNNALKVKEYQAKVDEWSRKKNEYDTYITNQSEVTHDFLLEQSVEVGDAIDYIRSERQKILETYSGETVEIF